MARRKIVVIVYFFIIWDIIVAALRAIYSPIRLLRAGVRAPMRNGRAFGESIRDLSDDRDHIASITA
jgi:hypothetical protein